MNLDKANYNDSFNFFSTLLDEAVNQVLIEKGLVFNSDSSAGFIGEYAQSQVKFSLTMLGKENPK